MISWIWIATHNQDFDLWAMLFLEFMLGIVYFGIFSSEKNEIQKKEDYYREYEPDKVRMSVAKTLSRMSISWFVILGLLGGFISTMLLVVIFYLIMFLGEGVVNLLKGAIPIIKWWPQVVVEQIRFVGELFRKSND